jgi:membrane-bound metal-dependent hydrolase YbcI (DUF457 family)
MPEPLIHFFVPFIMLAFYGFEFQEASAIAIFGILPDVDVLFGLHRGLTHSIIVLFLVSLPFIVLIAYRYRGYFNMALLSMAALISHPLLDTMTSHTPILWPLLSENIRFFMQINVNPVGNPLFMWDIGFDRVPISNILGLPYENVPILTELGLVFLVAIFVPIVLQMWQSEPLNLEVEPEE